MLLWLSLLYRWTLGMGAVSGLRVGHSVKMWTILSSPKCHKVGRLQLAHREALYGLDFAVEHVAGPASLGGVASLFQLLRDLSGGFDHGFLRLRSVTACVRSVLWQLEACRWSL
jgi:hypothetical protein